MAVIAHIATYPRRAASLTGAIERLHPQVDGIQLILNEYDAIPSELAQFGRLQCHLPERDLKDTGKFYPPVQRDDYIFLCDDDLLYPPDYVSRMKGAYDQYALLNPVVGVHGVRYPQGFNGTTVKRQSMHFAGRWSLDATAHQLGTGTVVCKGWQMPSFAFMQEAQRYTDLLFACHASQSDFPMVVIKREEGWLREVPDSQSIYHTFTTQWPQPLMDMARNLADNPLMDIEPFRPVRASN